ncbi:MAG: ABC transporter ATP-binding protein [Chitinophagales bacterium]
MSSIKQIIQYIAKYRFAAFCNIFFNILAVLFSLVSLAMILPFLRLLFDTQDLMLTEPTFSYSANYLMELFNYTLSNIIVQYGKIDALLFVCMWVVVVFFLKNLFRYTALYAMAAVRNGVVYDIRKQVFEKITKLSVSYFSEKRKGDTITRLSVDVQEIELSIMSVLEATVREPITILTYLITMIIISPQLSLFVLLILPITGIIIGNIGKTLKSKSHKAQNYLASIMSIIDETLSGLRIIKAFNAQKTQQNSFDMQNEKHKNMMTSIVRRRSLSSPLSELLSIVVVVIVLYIGGRMVLSQTIALEAETFILFMVVFSQIIPPAKQFSTAFYNIQKGLASLERINNLLEADIEVKNAEKAITISDFKEKIAFCKVFFAYEKEQNVLKNINFELKKGEMLALVGNSGAGKTTLADLLVRFYDVTKGEILLDGINIKQYDLQKLRKLMGIVTQEPILFHDTVLNNIAFGLEKENVSREQIIQAAKVANAHDFIMQLENNYDTIIGDRGHKLSGGERQRLTIARAVLKNPPILILDEATSSLDSASEKLVQDALHKLMQNRTSIVIAHRLSTIQAADKILVLKDGEILEQGTHKSLLQTKSMYKKLVDLQAF